MLIKFQLPSITFTLINSRETASHSMMNSRYRRGPYGRSTYGSSDRSSGFRGRYGRNKPSSKGISSYQQQSNLPPIESTIPTYRSPYRSSRASSASSRSGYYPSGLGPQSVR